MARIAAAHAQSIDYQGLEQLFGEPVTTSVTGKPQRVADARPISRSSRRTTSGDPARPTSRRAGVRYGMDVRGYAPGAADVVSEAIINRRTRASWC